MINGYFEKIEVTNYRLCKSCQFKPNLQLNALIGPNGSGKTTLLRAIYLLKQLERLRYGRFKVENAPDPTRIKVWLKIEGKRIIHTSDLIVITDENNDDEVYTSEQKWYMRDITGSKASFSMPLAISMPLAMADEISGYYDPMYEDVEKVVFPRRFAPAINFEYLKEKNVMQALAKVSDFYKRMTYYSASQFTNPSNCPVSFEIDENKRPTARRIRQSSHAKWLYDMYIEHRDATQEFTQYKDIIGPHGIGLIDEIEFQETELSSTDVSVQIGGVLQTKKRETSLIIPKLYIGNSVLSPTQLSEGTFKTLAMVFYLMTGKSRVVLLEEPEVCIHHGLLSSLIELIKQYSREKQIFISTHSDYILDELQQENVFVVQNHKTNGICLSPLNQWVPKEDISALKQFLASEGSLGEYWRLGGIDDEPED